MKEYFLIEISFRFWIRFQFKSLIKDGAAGAFSQTLIFFQMIFSQHFRARRMQRSQRATIQGKNIKDIKSIFKHFQNCKHFCTVQGHSAVLFQHKSQDSITRKITALRACIGLMNGLLNGLLNKNVTCLQHSNSCTV